MALYPARIKASSLNKIGFLLNRKGEKEKALHYYKESLVILKERGDLDNISALLTNMGAMLYNMKQYEQALLYLEECLELQTKIGSDSGLTKLMINLAKRKIQLSRDN